MKKRAQTVTAATSAMIEARVSNEKSQHVVIRNTQPTSGWVDTVPWLALPSPALLGQATI